jgi:glycosyltransferase involved in cell wall biosynthesis
MSEGRKKLIFLVTEDWYFWSHRLPMARAAQATGFDVAIATRVAAHGERIERAGFRLLPMRWRREELGPWASLAAICEIYRLYRRERPFIVHHVALKAAMFGGIAAFLARVPGIVSIIAGIGYLGTSARWQARAMAAATRVVWPWLLLRRNCRLIVQNDEDRRAILALRPAARERVIVIRGSGVDLAHFQPLPEPPAPPVTVAYVGRMIAIKGVADLVAAQQKLQQDGVEVRLVLAGTPDPANPSSLAPTTLEAWSRLPGIRWLGHCADVRAIWAEAHIAALASHGGEGLPKTLLEAAAMGRAIVATDVPGTREIARDGINAALVPPGDIAALAAALAQLAGDPALRRRYAVAGRRVVEEGFSESAVTAATCDVYRALAAAIAPSR